ncbi:MAG: ABC transporter substrate-binding protein [Thermoanaerobaculia bacterium]|nr:ABC transporter substrate-binding protein [Thermoanaerobaculia bacterium]
MIRDALGRSFDAVHPPRRIVSLVPSVTETLFDLGAGANVAGITDFCIFPPDLVLPRVGGTKNPRIDLIRELKPDLVHMNLEENLERHAKEIEMFARVFVSEPKSVAEAALCIEDVGVLHGCEARARDLIRSIESQLAALPQRSFTFACPIWKQPWMWCGGDTYVSSLVAAAGGRNVAGDRTRYPTISIDEIAALRPDVIFLPDEPYLFTAADAAALAPIAKRIIGPFPGHLFTWHGTRTIKGLEFLREVRL